MKRIGYQLENVSLHYRGNQGLDLIFRTANGELAIVTTPTYAVVEAKHGKGLESLSRDRKGRVQGSPEYNESRLLDYLQNGDGSHNAMALTLKKLAKSGLLKSYATFYMGKSIYELQSVRDKRQIQPLIIP